MRLTWKIRFTGGISSWRTKAAAGLDAHVRKIPDFSAAFARDNQMIAHAAAFVRQLDISPVKYRLFLQ